MRPLRNRPVWKFLLAAAAAGLVLSCAAETKPPDLSAPKPEPVTRPSAPTDVPQLKDAYELPPAILFRSVSASSTLPDPLWGPEGYAAWHLVDSDPELPWCAGNRLLGIGEEIQFEFLHPVDLNSLTLEYPVSLPGPKVVQLEIITSDNESRMVDIPAGGGRRVFIPVSGRRFRLVIRKVAAGGDGTLCIGELKLGGRADVLDTRFPPDAAGVATSQIRSIFADIETFRQPSLGRPKLVRALSDFFGRWTGPGELASARLLFDYQFQTSGDVRESEDNLCVVATRAVIEASGIAERLYRERYLRSRAVPLLEGCAPGVDLSYWVLRQNRMAPVLFNSRGTHYAALEAGDPRALPRLLATYRQNTRIGWWRDPVPGFGRTAKSPESLVRGMAREPVRRILDELISFEDAGNYYLDGLKELRRQIGP